MKERSPFAYPIGVASPYHTLTSARWGFECYGVIKTAKLALL